MEKIESFKIDHTKLLKGMYVSRIDGDVVTYDIRMRRPNIEPVMETGAMHTIEHLFATFARNSEYSKNIIYFGPMGCRTGFYFLTTGITDGYHQEHDSEDEILRHTFISSLLEKDQTDAGQGHGDSEAVQDRDTLFEEQGTGSY